ncbi:MAG TPA: BrnT family toxin [Rhizomicrobium sp.]|nr:BrnT family toxin [Rhizomicrobium sp.]
MKIVRDEDKRSANLAKHKLDRAAAEDFDFGSAIIDVDNRFDYGETRYQASGRLGDALYMLVFTWRRFTVRAISMRKASRAERTFYAKNSS